MTMGKRLSPAVIALGALLLFSGCGSSSPVNPSGPGSLDVQADLFTLKTPPLANGQFELLTVSTFPDAVTDGDVQVAARGLQSGDSLKVFRDGADISPVFAAVSGGEWRGLVSGLAAGPNELKAIVSGPAGTRIATLTVVNHPITGPVISGPHQTPFICQTEAAGLGKALDADCSIKPQLQWYYKSILDQSFHLLSNPYAAYPLDTARTVTSAGRRVPFVARVESATINRGIARIALLDDPAARGPDAPFKPLLWNGRVYYAFDASCGPGYHQGINAISSVLPGPTDQTTLVGAGEQASQGDIVVHSTLTTWGVDCNPLISIETSMMIKEHIIEQYGLVQSFVGGGDSGGSHQINNAINNDPGLLTAGLTSFSFPDQTTTLMTVSDCILLEHYFGSASGWNLLQTSAVEGQLPLPAPGGRCASWVAQFLALFQPSNGCDASVPQDLIYNAKTNPDGARCTWQDANVNLFGRDPATGFALRPADNTGVQYGLQALNQGTIGVDQFLDMNQGIGGLDIDGNYIPSRMRMDSGLASRLYHAGLIIGRGSFAQTPEIDLGTYLDLIPSLNIHAAIHPFITRARLRAHAGEDATMAQWRGVIFQPDVYPIMSQWVDSIQAASVPPNDAAARVAVVIAAKPTTARDTCSFGTLGGRLVFPSELILPGGIIVPLLPAVGTGVTIPLQVDIPEAFDTPSSPVGPCEALLPVTSTPRMVAGGPLRDDVIRCQLKPIDPADYAASLNAAQLERLRSIFPDGVCNWAKPAAEDVQASMSWPSLGTDGSEIPQPLRWRVARSAPGE